MHSEQVLKKFNDQKKKHLITSVILDVLGMFTYIIPILGELGDIIYAPIYGISIFVMYKKGRVFSAAIGGFVGAVEEILPGTDFIPSASLMWAYTYVLKKDSTLKNYTDEKRKELEIVNQQLNKPKRKWLP